MPASYNKLTIIGHLGHDPTMRYLPDGTPVTTFDVAVNERRPVNGQSVQSTQWFHIACYGKLADTAGEHLRQGRSVLVEGPLTVREYVGQTGLKRASLDIRARELRMLDALKGVDLPGTPTRGGEPPPAMDRGAVDDGAPAVPDDLDEVPF